MKRLDAEGLKKILDEHAIQYKEDPYKGGMRFKLARCLFDENHQNSSCFLIWPDGRASYICRHDSCQCYRFADAIQKLEPNYFKNLSSFDFRSPSQRPKGTTIDSRPQLQQDPKTASGYFGGENGKTFLFNVLGDVIMQEYHCKTFNGKLYFFLDGKYTADKQTIGRVIRSYYSGMRKSQKDEVMSYLLDCAPAATPADPRYIFFKNGVFDLEQLRLMPATPDYFTVNLIPHDYNPAAYSQAAEASFKAWACDDIQIMKLLCEIIGYSMYRSARFKKSFVLLGDHDSGKSTFLRMLSALLGEDNVCSLDLKELSERFAKADLSGSLCNLGDDISSDYISDSALFKKITGGSRIRGEYKGQDGFNFVSYATMIFSANKMPKMEDKSGATTSRLIFVPFEAAFKSLDGSRNAALLDQLCQEESIQYFIKCGIDALISLIKNDGTFTMPERAEKIMAEYEIENDSVLAFLEENDTEESIIGETPEAVFYAYKAFCERNNYKFIGERALNKCLRKQLSLSTQISKIRDEYGNRKSVRRYTKSEKTENK